MKKQPQRSVPLIIPKYITDDGSEIESEIVEVISRSKWRDRKRKPIHKVFRRYETDKDCDNSQDISQSEEIMDNHYLRNDHGGPMNWKIFDQRQLKKQVANLDQACGE